jgi:hypothetical protein
MRFSRDTGPAPGAFLPPFAATTTDWFRLGNRVEPTPAFAPAATGEQHQR